MIYLRLVKEAQHVFGLLRIFAFNNFAIKQEVRWHCFYSINTYYKLQCANTTSLLLPLHKSRHYAICAKICHNIVNTNVILAALNVVLC